MLDRIRHLLGIEKRAAPALSSPDLSAIFGVAPTAAGAHVSAETALRSPTTLAACRAISEAVGALPVHLFRRGPDGSRERETAHPAAALLAGDWAPWAGGVETRTALQLDALLHGAAFAQVVRVNGAPREIHRLDPRSVTVEIDAASEPRFRVRQASGGDRLLGWRDVLYVPTPGSTLGRPVCLISLAREAIAVDMVMAEHQARLFGNGARPAGVLEYPGQLGPEVVKRLRESFNSAHAGGPNSGKTLILEGGMTFRPISFSSVDAQFLELRRLAIEEIARAFKVPLSLVGDLTRATWNNVTELGQQFLTHTLLPWIEIWQSAIERVLLRPEERGEYFVEVLTADLLRADISARFQAYRDAVGGSWLTANEARALENRPPVEGGDSLILQAGQAGADAGAVEDET